MTTKEKVLIGLAAVVIVAVGVSAMDPHAHKCDSCGFRWRHLGKLNFGSVPAHTCRRCGAVQFWQDSPAAAEQRRTVEVLDALRAARA